MAITHSGDFSRPITREITGPAIALGAACLGMLAVTAATTRMLPTEMLLPTIATALFCLSAVVAAIAWQRGPSQQRVLPSYWDVAGLLTFVGICVAALIEPDAMAQLIETSNKPR
jgi:tryptophan-rich sensory protein